MAAGISETTAQDAAMEALLDAARKALADEQVDIGHGFRWPIVNRDWFFGAATSSEIDHATIGGRRSLDETITLTVSVGTWQPYVGDEGDDDELATLKHSFELLGKVQQYIRTQDPTLGGTVLWCRPGSSTSDTTDSTEVAEGRITEIIATFVCSHRIATA